MNRLKALGITVAVVGFFMTGCGSMDPMASRFPSVSDYTFIPSKDFVVVGAVVLRDVDPQTLVADLMDAAIAIGGHDIINIRVDWRWYRYGHTAINTATAVVIRYTEETLMEESTVTTVMPDGTIRTDTSNRFVGITGGPDIDDARRRRR